MQGTWVQTATTALEDSIQLWRALQTQMKDIVRNQLPTIEMDDLMTRGRRCGRDCSGPGGASDSGRNGGLKTNLMCQIIIRKSPTAFTAAFVFAKDAMQPPPGRPPVVVLAAGSFTHQGTSVLLTVLLM